MTLNKVLLGRQPKHFSSFSRISVALHMLFILDIKIFSKTVNYACRFVLRLRDQSAYKEVARAIEVGIWKRVESKKGSSLNLTNLREK